MIAFGNGGSATGLALCGRVSWPFKRDRHPISAITLVGDLAVVTCVSNDFGYVSVFERQIQALTEAGDVVVGLTTSGTSENVVRGLSSARARGARIIALTGASGLVRDASEFVLAVPSSSIAHIQEVHLLIIHIWFQIIDDKLASPQKSQNLVAEPS